MDLGRHQLITVMSLFGEFNISKAFETEQLPTLQEVVKPPWKNPQRYEKRDTSFRN